MKQLLYVCLDGLADEPNPELGGLTPLEAARTPNMDFHDGDLAYRVNFATRDNGVIVDRRVGRDLPSDEARELAAEVNRTVRLPGAAFELLATIEHRGALVIGSVEGPLSANVTNTDPAYAKQGSLGVALETFENRVATATPLDDSEAAARAAELTNRFVEEAARVLEASDVNRRRRAQGRLPANLILTRDAGDHVPHLEPIRERFGPSWGVFVEMPVERGIAMVLGMDPVDAPTGLPPADQYAAWAELAVEALGGYDAIYIHIKGPDVPAHDGRVHDKRENIEQIDRFFFGELLPRIDDRRVLLAVTADHATSCVKRAHTADPVPLLVAGPGVATDAVEAFGERAAREGGLGLLTGPEIVPRLVDLMRS